MAVENISRVINETISATVASAVMLAPRILLAMVVAAAGWLFAWILRKITMHAVYGLDQLLERKAAQKGLRYTHIKQSLEKFIGDAVFWFVLIFFFVIAVQVLQFAVLSTFLSDLLTKLPMFALGILIVVVSFAIGNISRQIVITAFEAMGVEKVELLGIAVKVFIILIGILLGLTQIGIDISFLATVISLSFGALLGALALAFGLGAQAYVANILAAAQVRKIYRIGDTVVIDGIRGKIVDIHAALVTLQSGEGEITLPAKLFLEKQSLLLDQEESDAA